MSRIAGSTHTRLTVFSFLRPVCPSIRSAGHSCGYSRVFPQGFPTIRNRDRMRGPAYARTYGRWFILFCGWRFLRVPECLNTLQSKRDFSISVSFWSLVAACGSKWQGVASFSARFQGLKRPTFAPKRQGKAESAYRRPRLVLLLGSGKVSGYRCLTGSVITGLSPIRLPRIFVSSKTQQGVL